MNRAARLFRGSEFPRWLVLLGIMAVGWPLACQSLVMRAEPPRAPPSSVASVPPLPPADSAPTRNAGQRSPSRCTRSGASTGALV